MPDAFSMCLLTKGGTLSLGVDYSKDSRFRWTDITQEQWYTVTLNDIKFGSQSIGVSSWDLNENGVIVDSGTTLFIVTTDVMTAINATLYSLCKTTNLIGICNAPKGQTLFDGQCFNMTSAQTAQFPTLTLTLDGLGDLTVQPTDYLWQGAGIPGAYCLGIQGMDGNGIIIGDVIMQRYHVVFDRYNSKVGFGPLSSCPSLE